MLLVMKIMARTVIAMVTAVAVKQCQSQDGDHVGEHRPTSMQLLWPWQYIKEAKGCAEKWIRQSYKHIKDHRQCTWQNPMWLLTSCSIFSASVYVKQEAGDGPGLCRAYILCGEIRPALSVSSLSNKVVCYSLRFGSLSFWLIRMPNSMWK